MVTVDGRLLVALLTLGVITAVGAADAVAHDPSVAPAPAHSPSEQLTTDLVRLDVQYQLAGSAQKPRLEQDLLAVARIRKQELLGLMESDPGQVLRLSLPGGMRARMP